MHALRKQLLLLNRSALPKCPFVSDGVSCSRNVRVCFWSELQSIPPRELFHVAFLRSFHWLTVPSVVAMATWHSVFSLRALHAVIRCHPQSAPPLLCSSTSRGLSIDGTFELEASPSFVLKNLQSDLFSLIWSTAMATSVISRERGVGNKWA